MFLSICRSKAFIERVLKRCFSVLNIILLLFAWKLLFKSSSFNNSFSSVFFFHTVKAKIYTIYADNIDFDILKPINEISGNLEINRQIKMTILPETFRWWLNGNTLANPKKWYHWWHRKKRIMKDSSSLIFVKSFKQLGPYAYHTVLVIFSPVHNTTEKIKNAVLFLWFGLLSTINQSRIRNSFFKTLFKPDKFENAFIAP